MFNRPSYEHLTKVNIKQGKLSNGASVHGIPLRLTNQIALN